jgi:PAS domain S-box-containing protein
VLSPPLDSILRPEISEQLERQVQILSTTLSSISDFAYIFDRDGRFLFANKPLLDLWGLPLNAAVGKNFFDLSYPDALAVKLHHQIDQVFRTGQRLADEAEYVSPAGIAGYYEYIFSPVFGADGFVEVVVGSTRDITARKRTETLIDAQRRSLEMLVNGKPLCEILTFLTQIVEQQSDRQSIASILLLDEQGCLRLGAAPSLPDDYNQAIDGIKARADLGTCSVAAVTGKCVVTPDIDRDSKWAPIKHLPLALGLKAAWSQPILARDGQVLGTFGTYFRECREPTALERQVVEILSHTAALAIERGRADEEREALLASERRAHETAEAANKAKDRFIAVLSHELRTPLSPVMMAVPAMERDADLPPKFRDDLAMVRRNIDLEVKLIDDLLDLSRVTSGKLRLEAEPLHVHEVLRHAINNGASDFADKQIRIYQEFTATDDSFTADAARLQQVFWNLVRNAFKFTPQGGEVVVRTCNECQTSNEGGASHGASFLVIEVRDTGVGIAADLLPRIFEPFEQGKSNVSHRGGGLGLGLAIAKAVVEMHRGTITAASDGLSRGAIFTIRFPITADQPVRKPSFTPMGLSRSTSVASTDRQTRILLVEDHADTAKLMARLLKRSGYDVRNADSAAAALDLAERESFDLVVSDIGLPDATGYELMKQLGQRHGLKGIALTGYGMEDDLRKSREAGFVDHVVKPVNMQHLEAAIDRVKTRQPA